MKEEEKKPALSKAEYNKQYREKNREAIRKRQRLWHLKKREKTMIENPKRQHAKIYYVDEDKRLHFPNPKGYTSNEVLAIMLQAAKEVTND